jgi:hypothetical protein
LEDRHGDSSPLAEPLISQLALHITRVGRDRKQNGRARLSLRSGSAQAGGPNSICSRHVERHNLSIRTFLRRFTRLALGFSKKKENLEAAIALYLCHYNFSRLHGTLRGTPAMRAGIAGHPWTLVELLENAGV